MKLGDVLWTAARHGDRALFDRLRAAAKEEKDEIVKRQLIVALGSFQHPEIIKVALPIILTDEFDSRLSLSILYRVAQKPQTRDLAYDFVKQNWDALVAKLPTDSGAYLPYIASYCDEEHRQDVQSFFKDRSTKFTGGPRILDQVLEGIHLCEVYKKAQQPSVTEFLEHYKGGQANGHAGRKSVTCESLDGRRWEISNPTASNPQNGGFTVDHCLQASFSPSVGFCS
jgi:alanyl aminopeptidase